MKASDVQVGGGHYKDFAIQPSEFIHRNGIGFMEGNVIKYVCRHKQKHGRQDIEKAIHYLQLLLEWEYPQETEETVLVFGEPVEVCCGCRREGHHISECTAGFTGA
jgi:hypothetical protein